MPPRPLTPRRSISRRDGVDDETRLRMKLNSGRIAAARGKLAEAEAICRSVANSGIRQPGFLIDADELLAKILEREKRPQDAEAALKQALAELDNSRAQLLRDESKLTYSAGLIQVFRDYVDLLNSQNRVVGGSRDRGIQPRPSVIGAVECCQSAS